MEKKETFLQVSPGVSTCKIPKHPEALKGRVCVYPAFPELTDGAHPSPYATLSFTRVIQTHRNPRSFNKGPQGADRCAKPRTGQRGEQVCKNTSHPSGWLLSKQQERGLSFLEPILWRQGSQVSMRVARGSASLLSSHGRVLSLAQTHRGRPQTTSTRLYAVGELQGSPVWQALAGH